MSIVLAPGPSVEQFLRHVAAVVGDLLQHGLVQPHVHLGGIAHEVGRAAELDGEFLAGREAAVDVEQLQQVDDRDFPVELLRIRRRQLLELCDDVDDLDGLRGRRGWRGGGAADVGLTRGGGVTGAGAGSALADFKPSFSRILPKKLIVTSLQIATGDVPANRSIILYRLWRPGSVAFSSGSGNLNKHIFQ